MRLQNRKGKDGKKEAKRKTGTAVRRGDNGNCSEDSSATAQATDNRIDGGCVEQLMIERRPNRNRVLHLLVNSAEQRAL